MNGYVMTFEFTTLDGSHFIKKLTAYSRQLGWIQAGGYIACHTLNPPITGVKLLATHKIVSLVCDVTRECSEEDALRAVHHMN